MRALCGADNAAVDLSDTMPRGFVRQNAIKPRAKLFTQGHAKNAGEAQKIALRRCTPRLNLR
jgi:hypothetical protein